MKPPAFAARLASLLPDTRGLALLEFALSLPVVLGVVLAGLELTNFTITKMRVSQLALQVADNGSRIGTASLLTAPQISEAQINDLLAGANRQGGTLGLFTNGRVIVSSLEPDTSHSGKYQIRWQRCKGAKSVASSYGTQGTTDMVAMGPTGRQVTAPTNGGVIYVEVVYDYQPLVFERLVPHQTIREVAAMTVRDDRDFTGNGGTGVYNNEAVTPASCSAFSAT